MKRWAGVARFGGVGDNLVAASVCAPLKRQGYMVEMITSPNNHVLFNNNPYIDKLSVKTVERDLPQGDLMAWQKWFASRANEYDVFAHLSHSMEGRHAVFPSMTSFWWPEDYRRELCAGSYLETAHRIAGVPFEFGPLFWPTDDEYERAYRDKEKLGGRFIIWIISGSRIDKVYPYCAMAVTRILKELKIPVLLMGAGEKERNMALAIQNHVEIQNSGLQGLHLALSVEGSETGGNYNWPLRRSLTMALVSDLVISPDTGPAWAVAFEKIPKVMMVSHASVENITKHWINTNTLHADPNRCPCWPCHRLHNDPSTCVSNKEDNGAKCISDISIETVFEAVRIGLAENTNLRLVA